jgi:hypothetical protein
MKKFNPPKNSAFSVINWKGECYYLGFKFDMDKFKNTFNGKNANIQQNIIDKEEFPFLIRFNQLKQSAINTICSIEKIGKFNKKYKV